jgi:hypothetical protein
MKRFWLVLLSLGLIMAFSASAFAVDVKFSGSYYVAGAYVDKLNLVARNADGTSTAGSRENSAFYFQRLQLTTEFVAAPGLSLITRANILEREWGGVRSAAGAADATSAAFRNENENIGFDYAYINYASPIGLLRVGYMNNTTFGTAFADNSAPAGRILYTLPIGKFQLGAGITKSNELSASTITAVTNRADNDNDKYSLWGVFTDKNIETGVLGNFYNDARLRRDDITSNYGRYYSVIPYAKAKIGPFAIQAEIDYFFGRLNQFDSPGVGQDTALDSLAGFIDVLGTFGKVYVGATFVYAQGQGNDLTKINNVSASGIGTGGRDFNPCLILWNSDINYWAAGQNFSPSAAANTGIANALVYQVRGGVKPTDKLDIGASVSFAQMDKQGVAGTVNSPAGPQYVDTSRDIGWEIDVTGAYKITNNLSYMLGVGYVFTGDALKGVNKALEVNNDYLVINKLTLTF